MGAYNATCDLTKCIVITATQAWRLCCPCLPDENERYLCVACSFCYTFLYLKCSHILIGLICQQGNLFFDEFAQRCICVQHHENEDRPSAEIQRLELSEVKYVKPSPPSIYHTLQRGGGSKIESDFFFWHILYRKANDSVSFLTITAAFNFDL